MDSIESSEDTGSRLLSADLIPEDGSLNPELQSLLQPLAEECVDALQQTDDFREQMKIDESFNAKLGIQFTNNLRLWFVEDDDDPELYDVSSSTQPEAAYLRSLLDTNPEFFAQCCTAVQQALAMQSKTLQVAKDMQRNPTSAGGETSDAERRQLEIDECVSIWTEGLYTTKAAEMLERLGAQDADIKALCR